MRTRVDGRLVSRSFRADGVRAAKRAMVAVEGALVADARRAVVRQGTVADLVADWLRICERDRSPSTVREYRMHSDRFVAAFGPLPVNDVTGKMLDEWYGNMLADGRTPATVQHTHRIVRAVLRWGHRNRDVTHVATERCTPPQHAAAEVSPPSDDVVRRLLAGVSGEWGRAVKLSAFTGLRRGEIVGLRWEHVEPTSIGVVYSVLEMPDGTLHIKTPKGRRSRRVEIGPAAAAVLAEQRAEMESRGDKVGASTPWVFANWKVDPTGRTPRRPGWLSLSWSRHRDKHGAPDVHLHSLRHWYATTALASGVPLHAVSAQLGHAQASTTSNIYGHATDAGRMQAAINVERAVE